VKERAEERRADRHLAPPFGMKPWQRVSGVERGSTAFAEWHFEHGLCHLSAWPQLPHGLSGAIAYTSAMIGLPLVSVRTR
jgi:hypothetical protein